MKNLISRTILALLYGFKRKRLHTQPILGRVTVTEINPENIVFFAEGSGLLRNFFRKALADLERDKSTAIAVEEYDPLIEGYELQLKDFLRKKSHLSQILKDRSPDAEPVILIG